jgi:lysophospholipase
METAPFFSSVAGAPEGGTCHWLRASDGVRLRVAIWDKGANGTVFVFPGRTEYIEKYGPLVDELARRGYAALVIDWRGQGLSDRPLDDPATGHVTHFSDYQRDVQAMLAAARAQGPPEPYYLLAHSMGGGIGLRALIEGMPVAAAAFSAPMWGIKINPYLRPIAWALGTVGRMVGQGHRYAPGTSGTTYVGEAGFPDNVLTTDAEMFAFMQEQVRQHPELALGGPSLHWLHEALLETRLLAQKPSPDVPCYTGLGTHERVVDPRPVRDRLERWPGSKLVLFEGAEHELIMERPEIRERFFGDLAAFFAANRRTPGA